MRKASFDRLEDMSGAIQLYFERDALLDGLYAEFKGWDVGDLIGVEGTLFRTRTGELTVRAAIARLLSKCLRPLPEKYHGLAAIRHAPSLDPRAALISASGFSGLWYRRNPGCAAGSCRPRA